MCTHDKVIETVQKFIAISNKLSEELTEQQLALKLEEIFLPEYLACSEKRKESLEKLDKLASLLEAHKVYYSQLTPQFENQLSFRFSQYPENERNAVINKHKKKLQYKIVEQYTFFENRGDWINHVRDLVHLLERNPDELRAVNDTLELQDSIFEEFISIDNRVREASEREREIGEARKQRMVNNANKLGIKLDLF